MTTLLLFDFDGVLIRSEKELALTAYNGVSERDDVTTLSELPSSYLEKFFNTYTHARNAAEMQFVAEWIDANEESPFPDFLESFLSSKEKLRERQKNFFAARKRLMNSNPDAWCTLNEPVGELWEEVKKIPLDDRVIVTNKNHSAVTALTEFHSLEIKDENIHSSDQGLTKCERITKILESPNASKAHFIDDSLRNLSEIAKSSTILHKLHLHHATWALANGDESTLPQPITSLSLSECISLIKSST